MNAPLDGVPVALPDEALARFPDFVALLKRVLGIRNQGEEAGDPEQFATYLPYLAFDEERELFLLRDGIGFAIEVMPQSGADEQMVEVLRSMFANWPAKATLQFSLFATPLVRGKLLEYARLRTEDPDQAEKAKQWGRPARNENIYRVLARTRVGYLLKGARQSLTTGIHYMLRDYRLVVSAILPADHENLAKREDLERLRDGLVSTLQAASLPSRRIGAEDLINWVALFANPHRLFQEYPKIHWDDGRTLRDQMVDFDTRQKAEANELVFRRGSKNESYVARFYSIRSFPLRFALWQMGGLIGDMLQGTLQYTCPFVLTMGVSILDQDKAKAWVLANHTRAVQNAKSQMAPLMPDFEEKRKDWHAAAVAIDQGSTFVDLYHSLGLFSPAGEMVRAERAAEAVWRARGFQLAEDTYLHRQSLIGSLPMGFSQPLRADLARLRRITTKTSANAVHLAPLVAEWRGTPTPVLILGGRRGQIMTLDLYDNTLGNYNAVVVGTSGSGKSVFLNELAWSYRATGAKVWMLDLGSSFAKLCGKAHGHHLSFAQTPNLNPFTQVLDIKDDMAMLQAVFAKMASPMAPLDAFQWAALGIAIQLAWEARGPSATTTSVHEILHRGKLREGDDYDPRLRDLAIMIEKFTAHGVYAPYFEGESTVRFEEPFIVIEMEDLVSRPDLHCVATLLLLFRITTEMFYTRTQKKVLIIDELKQQLGITGHEDPALEQALEASSRRARKYGGSLVTATQGYDDYHASPALYAALSNADWIFMLRQKKQTIDILERDQKFKVDEYKKKLLGSLRTEEGVFSEIYIHSPAGEGVGRLILDPATLLTFSNRIEDNAPLDAKQQAGLSLDEAIAELLRERGVAA